LKRGQAVPEEISTQLTAVENRLAAEEQSPVIPVAITQDDTPLKDKVDSPAIC